MHDLSLVGVWIRRIDEFVQLLHGFPDRHDRSGFLVEVEFGALQQVVGHGLVGMLGCVFVDYVLGGGDGFVLSELGFVF